MANYKFPLNDNVQIGGYTRILRATDKIIHLELASSGLGTPETLHNLETDVLYQVPAGKKLRIFYLVSAVTNIASHKLYTTTASDSMTGSVEILSRAGLDNLTPNSIFLSDVASSLYVTMDSIATNTHAIRIVAIEMNN